LNIMDRIAKFRAPGDLGSVESRTDRVNGVVVASDRDKRNAQLILEVSEIGCCVVMHMMISLTDISRQNDSCRMKRQHLVQRVAHSRWGVHDVAEKFAFFYQVQIGELNES